MGASEKKGVVVFVLRNETERSVSFSAGQTILQVAQENDIHITSACEGMGICGTCHVAIENLHDKLPKISDQENDTLDGSIGVTMQSRLACQVVLDETMDGLRVKI
ncbi:MAG: 2Fe-2S iron-sulfur cluster binding domain-containing protein [Holosporaceae bacterium]|jgi:2Fe-2S ferredoxin|nr:2Fe-2S iron-sulfur cluster binding domain-containing protein [Holosporaceae bacterium]